MWEKTMFDGVVFGAIWGIVGNTDFNSDFVGQDVQVLLENIVTGTVASATIAEDKNRGGVGVVPFAVIVPPMSKTITGKFAGIMTGAKLNIANKVFP